MYKTIVSDGLGLSNDEKGLYKLGSGNFLKTARFTKEAVDYVEKDFPPDKREKGKVYVLVIALGAGETYGPNKNGDYFPREVLKKYYKTFETHAKVFKHHVNKPDSPSYGEVIKAFWNPRMDRVELLISVDRSKAPDLAQKIDSGKDLPLSMSCVRDPNYPVLTKEGYKPISEITVGDYVFTHKANWKRVKALNRRRYTGKVMKFFIGGLPIPLELTEDHPMWSKVFEGSRKAAAVKAKARKYFTDSGTYEKAAAGWLPVKELQVGDRFFYNPINQIPGFGAIECKNLATIMGYYLAEGSFSYNGKKACTTQFSCHMDDSLPRRLPKIMEKLFPDITVKIKPRKHSPVSLSVDIFHTQFSEFLRKYVGRGCKNKVICPEIFNAEEEVKLSFLGAWHEGDGFVDKKGVHWSTVNRNLALQGRDLLASIGIPASIYKIDHTNFPNPSGGPGSIEYTLNISWIDGWRLGGYSEKVLNSKFNQGEQFRKNPAFMRECPDGKYSYRIKKIEEQDVTNIETYNIEVEDDESYVLAGLISHNCKVPFDYSSLDGKKHKTRRDYSSFVKRNLGKILDDGRRVYLINTKPRFFDISFVRNPADSTAYTLTKVAGTEATKSSAELAEELGMHLMDDEHYANSEIFKIAMSQLFMLRKNEPSFDSHTIEKLAEYPLQQSLSTLYTAGFCPKPKEFATLVLEKIAGADITWADEFDPTKINSCGALPHKKLDISPSKFSEEIYEKVASFIPTKSYCNNSFISRLSSVSTEKEEYSFETLWTPLEKIAEEPVVCCDRKSVTLGAVRELWDEYQSATQNRLLVKEAEAVVACTPVLMNSLRHEEEKTLVKIAARLPGVQRGLSGAGRALLGGTLGFLVPAGFAAKKIEKAERGHPLNWGEWKLLNPNVQATLSMLGAVAGAKLAYNPVGAVKGLAKTFTKRGTFDSNFIKEANESFLADSLGWGLFLKMVNPKLTIPTALVGGALDALAFKGIEKGIGAIGKGLAKRKNKVKLNNEEKTYVPTQNY